MNDAGSSLGSSSLTTPRAAAVARIHFAVRCGSSVALVHPPIPIESSTESRAWLATNARTIGLALNLVPYGGITFLWFIGVIRDRLGDVEDRFFATIFLDSRLLFLALTFMGAALAGGLLGGYAAVAETMIAGGVFNFGSEVMFQVIKVYAIRMAGAFMITLGTIWLRSGVMPRGWAFLTYALALALLVSISFSLWVVQIFPVWVLMVSIYVLLLSRHSHAGRAGSGGSTS